MPELPMIERMAEAYWNAFRDGFGDIGVDPKEYPEWRVSNDPVKIETVRCLRHAVQLLKNEGFDRFDELFPEPPLKRQIPVAED